MNASANRPPCARHPLPVAVGAVVLELGGGVDQPGEGSVGEGAPHRDPSDSDGCEFVYRRAGGRGQHVDWTIDRRDDGADVVKGAQAGREQHVGARLLVGLQSGNGVGQVVAAMDVVLGPGGEDQLPRPTVGRFGRRRHPLGGQGHVVDGIVWSTGEVLDRAAGKPRRRKPG